MTTEGAESYDKIGFDKYGMKRLVKPRDVSANDMDAFYELGDNMVRNKKIVSMNAAKLLSGTIAVLLSLGSSNVKIDGENKRIIINDGTNDRVLIGYGSGLF
jgi:hypothetical protein